MIRAKKELPLVSIITPSYNQGQYIENTIKSVLSQDYSYIEYIIVDGDSTDNTIDILKKYDNKIRWISEPDNGQSDAINKGFNMSKGEVVAWLNSDDLYCPGGIKAAVDIFLQCPDVAMIYGDGYEIDEKGEAIQKFPATQRFDLWKLIYVWDYILQPTVFMKKNSLFDVGLLDTSLNWCMDWDLWIRFAKRYRILYVPVLFAKLRVYRSTKTYSGGFGRFKEIMHVMRKHGNKRYPLGFFVYGQDTLENIIKERLPKLYDFLLKYPLLGLRCLIGKKIHKKQGFFLDNWVTKHSFFTVPVWDGDTLIIEGMAPLPVENFPLKIGIKINNREKSSFIIEKNGPFSIRCRFSKTNSDLINVTLHSNKIFTPQNDKRKLSFLLKDIYVEKTGD